MGHCRATNSARLLGLRRRRAAIMKHVACTITLLATAAFFGCSKSQEPAGSSSARGKQVTIAFMPKSKGNAYFVSCKQGADKAAKELGLDLIFDGPTQPDPAKQNEIVENWITLGVDAIAAA